MIGGNFKIFGRAVFEVIEVKFRYFDLKFFRQKRTALNLKIEQTIKFKPLNTATFRILSEVTLVPMRKGEVIEVRERGSQILTCLERLPLIDTSHRT